MSPRQISTPWHSAGTAPTPPTPWSAQASPDSETRVDGNQVVLEEEMMKMNDARMNYDAAIGFYEKANAMLTTAIRTPGKGS